jgi:ATP/maltotriose-dependent transcriptional regulator MalT
MHLSLLESLPLDACSRLFPDRRCSAVLPELFQKNVFLSVVGDGNGSEEYRLHPLFRDFLLRRLRSEIGRKNSPPSAIALPIFFSKATTGKKRSPF